MLWAMSSQPAKAASTCCLPPTVTPQEHWAQWWQTGSGPVAVCGGGGLMVANAAMRHIYGRPCHSIFLLWFLSCYGRPA